MEHDWRDVGAVEELRRRPVQEVTVGGARLAVTFRDGRFGALAGACPHAGGPLGEGQLDGDALVCPWHGWRFGRCDGAGARPDRPARAYAVKEAGGRLLVDLASAGPAPEEKKHPLDREPVRAAGPTRVLGISTTNMNLESPRVSTSERLLEAALAHAGRLGAETRLVRLAELSFRHCEGYYSQGARSCTWPCTITREDPADQMERVYEALVFWADVVLVATPIRWGAASSLYFKMAERMNCIQNQVTINDRVLIRNKVASFIITGGQDNIQAVAGQMLTFFGELGFQFPQFPFIAHSRGWTAEDMEKNVELVEKSAELREGAEQLAERCVAEARALCAREGAPLCKAGRKAQTVSLPLIGG